ncbi:MAG: sulfatase [Balneolaceae bacterium]
MLKSIQIISRLCFVFILTGLISNPLYSQTTGERPNIVLIMGDDMSAEDFGAYGNDAIQTPTIDGLAKEGIRFENAYQTTSSCSPARTSLISGRYPHNTGAPELHMAKSPHLENLPQFPHLLREAGYYSVQAGKAHFNGDVSKSFHKMGGSRPSGAENWVEHLQERPKDQPFFMWFAAHDAHRNWDLNLEDGPHRPDDVIVPPYLADGPLTRKDLAHYYNEIHRFDNKIAEVVEELKAQGVYENTLLIIVGEDGRPFPRSKCWLYDSGVKTPLVMHWPERLKNPSVPESLVSWIDLPPTILELAGVAVPPEFQGVSLTPFFDEPGTSVRDFVFAERNYHAQRNHERMVRHGDFVYIRNNLPELVGMNLAHYALDRAGFYFKDDSEASYSELVDFNKAGKANTPAHEDVLRKPRPAEMLFNVADDPHQIKNLAEDEEYAGTLNLLRNALDQWTEQTGDTIPAFEDMTPESVTRDNWDDAIGESFRGHPSGGEIPGEATRAWEINNPGPIFTKDIKKRLQREESLFN